MRSADVAVVITAYDQRQLVSEAVESARHQTAAPAEIVVVDDGSADPVSLDVLGAIEHAGVRVLHQENRGVSAARNAGVAATSAPYVALLDGDDAWEPAFLERAVGALRASPEVIAASAWMRTVGVLSATVRPRGGEVTGFLARNACPSSLVTTRAAFGAAGGYAEDMRSGFEDWDFCLRLFESAAARGTAARISVVPEPLIRYRTASASANIRSMEQRLARVAGMIERHRRLYSAHVAEAMLAWEEMASARLADIEERALADSSSPGPAATYGDGGMAAAVRVASARSGRRRT